MDANKRWWPARFDSYFHPRGEKPGASKSALRSSDTIQLTSTLAAYEANLTLEDIKHLLRRTQFGSRADFALSFEGQSASTIVDQLVDSALSSPLPTPPEWHEAYLPEEGSPEEEFDEYFSENVRRGDEYGARWLRALYFGGLRERMALFWHNHFVTELDTYVFAPMAHQYVSVLRSHALGNFRDFVQAITINPAMMAYLNGDLNVKEEPNENYARELLELFTLGQFDTEGNENYTQFDIVELSKALTGYYIDYSNFTTQWDPERHDPNSKVLFGHEGTYNTQGAIDHIFDVRAEQIARFICRKVYIEFIHTTPDEAYINELAQIFIEHDFEIAPVMRALLKSERFFDGALLGAQIKSPVAMMVSLLHQINFSFTALKPYEALFLGSSDLGQQLLGPPNVAGWKGYRSWLTTTTIPSRWELIEQLLRGGITGYENSLVPVASTLVNAFDPLIAFKLPVALAQHFITVPIEIMGYDAPSGDFSGDLETYPIPNDVMNGPAYLRDLPKIFLAGVPWYEWSMSSPGVVNQLLNYAQFLMELPEYHLA